MSSFDKQLEEELEKLKKKKNSVTVENYGLGRLSYLPSSTKLEASDIAPVIQSKQDIFDSVIRKSNNRRSILNNDEEEEAAPVKEESGLDFFQKGAFEDGFDWSDIPKTILGTVGDVGINALKGVAGIGEGIADLIVYGIASGVEASGDIGRAKTIRKTASESAVDDLLKKPTDFLDQYSVLGRTSDSIAQGIGQVGAIMATGGLGAAAGLGSAGVTALTTGVMGVSGMGSGMSEAYKGGATDEEAWLYGTISGAADALTELMFGGLGKAVNAVGFSKGLSSADDMLAKKVSGLFKKQIAKNFAEYGIKAGAEGFEEVVAGVAQAVGKKMTYMSDAELSEILQDENLLEQFVVGAVTSGIAQAPSLHTANKAKADFITGMTENDQAVVKKEVENRISEMEKDGKKLTSKEKADIQAKVEEALERGEISLDTIEEVLGGDDFTALQDTVTKENEALAELAELYEGEELQRHAESLLQDSKRGELQKKLRESVFDKVKDSRLGESYREDARYRMKFDADLNQYGEKERTIVQKAIDSGVLNNSRKTHEFVDFVAKVSSYSGIDFDFTSNQKLKETGFVFDGNTTNGFYDPNTNKVVINSQSKKYLHSLVGHEVTHALEGSGLYDTLQDIAFEYAKSTGEYKTRLKAAHDMYSNKTGYTGQDGLAKIKKEAVADMIGDYLFTDSKFVNHLSVNNPNVFQKIYGEIKHLLKLATAGSQQARQLEQLKYTFEKALREGSKGKGDTKYHISENLKTEIDKTLNNEMDKSSQVKARDFTPEILVKNGVKDLPMLITQKHVKSTIYTEAEAKEKGLPTGGKNHYHGLGKDVLIKAIDNMDDPLEVYRQDGDHYLVITEVQNRDGDNVIIPVKIDGKGNYNDVYIDENQIQSVYGKKNLASCLARNNFQKIYEKKGTALNEGVQFSNISDSSSQDADSQLPASDIKLAQKSNDVKSQYSLSAQQEEYFKDSVVRDENGNLKVMYHGTSRGGHTMFDPYGKAKYGLFGLGTYFTDNKEVAESYTKKGKGQSPQVYETYLNITNPMDMDAAADPAAWAKAFPDAHFPGSGTNEQFYRAMEEYFEDNEYVRWEAEEAAMDAIMGMGYDGITHIGGGRFNKNDDTRHRVYIAFQPEQIKNTDNLNPTDDPDIRYSLSQDSDGNQLTKEQQEYFKESKVRDFNGKLQVVYHASDTDFNVFSKDRIGSGAGNIYGKGFYFTYREDVAGDYGYPRAFYLNMKNPYVFDGFNYGDASTIAERWVATLNEHGIEYNHSDRLEKYHFDNEEVDESELIHDTVGVHKVADVVRQMGYDGIIIPSAGEYIAFEPEQIKGVGNTKPTDDPDIRYSLSEDSDGNKLTEEQEKYFRNSKMRDENGNLKVMYHGTQNGGFHVFDKRYSDDHTSFFFTDSNDVAMSYSGTSETYEAKTIRTAEDMNKFLAEIGYDHYEAREEGGKFVLYEDGEEVATSETAQGIYEEFCWYEGVGDGNVNYKCYLNLENPMEVDANGQEWNEIQIPEEHLAKFNESVFGKKDPNGFSTTATTRNFSEYANAQGYDGVIFKNILDIGGYGGKYAPHTVAIAFDGSQVKSVANQQPTTNKDIRYSISKDEPINRVTKNGLTMTYVRVPNQNTQYYGNTYGQNIEPAGEYMSMDTMQGAYKIDGYEYGTIQFKKPMLLEHINTSDTGWKKTVSDMYNGLTGKKLTKALIADGYDAIVTYDDSGYNEIVNLNGKKLSDPGVRFSLSENDFSSMSYAEITAEQQKINKRRMDLEQRKREAANNPDLLQAMDDYSNLFTEVRGLLSKKRNGTATPLELARIEEIKALKDEYLQRVADLQESLGLNAIAKEETEIRETVEALRVASDAAWAREGAEKENKAIEKAGMSAPDYFRKKALKAFKTTINFNEAGYLLPDGKMLNFSGGERNHRYRDHREIGEIYEATQGAAALNRFLNDGNIRVMAESPGIDIASGTEPTKEQYLAIRRFINANGVKDGQFFVDFSDADGRRAGNYAYQDRVNADRIINDIKHFYATGEIREQSLLDRFHHSLSEDSKKYGDLHVTSEDIRYNPEGRRSKYDFPIRKDIAPAAPAVQQDPRYSIEEMFPDDLAPVQQELSNLLERRAVLEEQMLEAGGKEDFDTFYKLSDEYVAVNDRIEELDSEERATDAERFASLEDADAPPEMSVPRDNLESDTNTPDPMQSRVRDSDDFKTSKPFMVERPEVKPFFQAMARTMLGDIRESVRGQRFYNDQVYAQSGAENAWTGVSRQTAADIAELLDNYHYSYDQIENALNAIIEDRVTERHLAAKNIEFMLNDRLLYGYTDVWGEQMPENQAYIDLAWSMSANDAAQESFDSYMKSVEDNLPPEAIGPVVEQTASKPKDIAPIKEKYEAVTPKKQPRMVKATPEAEKIAKILDEEPTPQNKKSRAWARFKANVLDKGAVFEDLSLKTKNRELMGKWNFILGSEARAQRLMGNGAEGVKSLNAIREEVENSGKSKQFYSYLYHKHNIDRMQLEERYEDMENKPVFGYSVTAEKSREIVANYERTNPSFKRYAKDIYDYMNHLRKLMVDNGVISQDTADLWADMYPNYVPIRRAGKNGAAVNVPLDTGRTGVNAPVKKATGGNMDILPLFDTMALRTAQTYKAIAKNSFGVELKKVLGTTIEKSEASVDGMIDSVEQQEGLLQEGKNGSAPTFTVFENGEKVTFEITEDMYDALKPVSEGLAYTNKIANTISNFHRGLLTEYNPVFMLTNAIKDAQDVMINSQHPGRTYLKMGEAYAQLLTKGYWYNEYMENGGEQNTYFDEREISFDTERKGVAKVLDLPPFSTISAINNFIEMTPRLAEYIASREAGRSIEVSMLDAARVTTNFQAGGDLTKFLNRNGATFLNASVQGLMQNVRNFREAKANGWKGWANLATKFAVAGLPAVILNNLLWDDDDEYEELSDYVKQNYYVVAKYGDGKFVRIPKGRTIAVIQAGIEQIGNALSGDDEVDLNRFLELVVSNLAPNNPIEDNILAPIIQVKNNKTWYGEDLVPTRLQDLPAAEQYDESTDNLSKWLGEKLDISPVKLNYLLDQYTGGVGDTFLPMMTPEAESGDDSLLGNFLAPLKSKFTTDSVMNNQNVSDFYDTKDELTTAAKSAKATESDVLKNKYMNSVNAELSELYAQKREIQNSSLPDSVKYQRVRAIQQQIVDLTKESLDAYDNISIKGDIATIGDRYFQRDDEGEWQKMSDSQIAKHKATSAAGDAAYATDGTNHYRWYEPGEDSDGEAGWRKVSDKELERQNEVTSALGISPEEYWSKQEEYSYAYEHPENYAVARSVGGYDAYRTYSGDLYDIKADKDESGKSISGSRKEKVIDYVNGLDIDYGMRLILFKNEYNADDTYNNEIIEYLNSRDDLSFSDTVTILRKLGFTVHDDGTIEW